MNAVRHLSPDASLHAPPDVGFGPALMADHQETFRHFLNATLFVFTHVLQYVGFLTVGFAVGAGWWAGLAVFAAIGIAMGIAFKRGPIYWAIEASEVLLLVVGGVATLLVK